MSRRPDLISLLRGFVYSLNYRILRTYAWLYLPATLLRYAWIQIYFRVRRCSPILLISHIFAVSDGTGIFLPICLSFCDFAHPTRSLSVSFSLSLQCQNPLPLVYSHVSYVLLYTPPRPLPCTHHPLKCSYISHVDLDFSSTNSSVPSD